MYQRSIPLLYMVLPTPTQLDFTIYLLTQSMLAYNYSTCALMKNLKVTKIREHRFNAIIQTFRLMVHLLYRGRKTSLYRFHSILSYQYCVTDITIFFLMSNISTTVHQQRQLASGMQSASAPNSVLRDILYGNNHVSKHRELIFQPGFS